MREVVKRETGKKDHIVTGSWAQRDWTITLIQPLRKPQVSLGGSNESSSSIGVMAVAEVLLLLARSFEGQGAVLEVLLILFRITSCKCSLPGPI